MKYPSSKSTIVSLAAAALTCAFAAAPALAAESPASKSATATSGTAAYGVKIGAFFSDDQKKAARKAFNQNFAKAKACPEGLEKTKKGCSSPWDTRYWAVGQSLQPAITAYPVPQPVAAQLPDPPKGYEYVRVADDILLIASGSKLVVDMIEHVAG